MRGEIKMNFENWTDYDLYKFIRMLECLLEERETDIRRNKEVLIEDINNFLLEREIK